MASLDRTLPAVDRPRPRFARPSLEAVMLVVVVGLVGYLALAPLGFLLYGSFSQNPPGEAVVLTLAHYAEAYSDPATWGILGASLIFAGGASTLAFAFGSVLAWITERTNAPLRGIIFLLTLMPVLVPTSLLALSWTMLLSPGSGTINVLLRNLFGLASPPFNVFTMGGMIWVAAVLDTPLAFLWMVPAFRAMDPSLEEAASMSGSSTLAVFRRVTLPLARPALLATWLIMFITALEDLAVPIFIGLPAKVVVYSTNIFLVQKRGPDYLNLASSYSTLLLVITVAGVMLYRRATRRAEQFATVTGKGYRSRPINLGRWRYAVTVLTLLLMVVIVVFPIAILFWNSLMPFPQPPTIGGLGRITGNNYAAVMKNDMLTRSLGNSTVYGLATGLVAMLLAALIGWLVVRSRVRFREAADFLGFLPISIPGLVVGIALIWVYLTLPIPIYGTAAIMIVAYVTRFLPYGIRLSYAGYSTIHAELEEASRMSGAGWLRTFRRISLPLLSPTLYIGVLYIAMRSLRELPASMMLATFGAPVFSVALFNLWEAGLVEQISAYAMLTVLALLVLMLAGRLLGRLFGRSPSTDLSPGGF